MDQPLQPKIKFINQTGPAMPAGKFNVDVCLDNEREDCLGTIQWSNPHGLLEPDTNVGEYYFVPNHHHLLTADNLLRIASAMIKLEAQR